MQLWACTLMDFDAVPPFADCSELHKIIDSIELADVPWESFTVSCNPELVSDDNETPWKHASYEVWFRDPLKILKNQLSNRDFANEMDFAPKQVYDRKSGKRRYQNFMSGMWAWRQAVSTLISVHTQCLSVARIRSHKTMRIMVLHSVLWFSEVTRRQYQLPRGRTNTIHYTSQMGSFTTMFGALTEKV